MKDALEWCQGCDARITDKSDMESMLNLNSDAVRDAGRQLYAVLAQVCEGEVLDLIQNVVDSDGWELWRVLIRFSIRKVPVASAT